MLRYRVTKGDGGRVENTIPVGFVRDFPKEKDAWREVDRLGLLVRINDIPCPVRIRFTNLAEHYLKHDMGSGRSPSQNRKNSPEHYADCTGVSCSQMGEHDRR